MTDLSKRAFLRPSKVAELLDISRDTVYRMARNGDLDGVYTSPRSMRITVRSIRDYLNRTNPDAYLDIFGVLPPV